MFNLEPPAKVSAIQLLTGLLAPPPSRRLVGPHWGVKFEGRQTQIKNNSWQTTHYHVQRPATTHKIHFPPGKKEEGEREAGNEDYRLQTKEIRNKNEKLEF